MSIVAAGIVGAAATAFAGVLVYANLPTRLTIGFNLFFNSLTFQFCKSLTLLQLLC